MYLPISRALAAVAVLTHHGKREVHTLVFQRGVSANHPEWPYAWLTVPGRGSHAPVDAARMKPVH